MKLDLGNTAVRYLRIKAYDSSKNEEQVNYVWLDIKYPTISSDNLLEDVINFMLKKFRCSFFISNWRY